jgi:hypothetical protein
LYHTFFLKEEDDIDGGKEFTRGAMNHGRTLADDRRLCSLYLGNPHLELFQRRPHRVCSETFKKGLAMQKMGGLTRNGLYAWDDV